MPPQNVCRKIAENGLKSAALQGFASSELTSAPGMNEQWTA